MEVNSVSFGQLQRSAITLNKPLVREIAFNLLLWRKIDWILECCVNSDQNTQCLKSL